MTVYFPDVSDFQAGESITGAAAVICKATEGTAWTATTYPGFKAQAAQMGIPFAAYHYMDGTDLQAQAQHAFDHIGPGVGTMWDCEVSGDVVSRILDLTARYRALGGNPTLVYLPHWFWQQIGSPDLRPLAAAGLSLISSNYVPYSDTGPGWAAYGGVAPAVWQYTDRQQLNGHAVDFNAFKGTVAQLRELFNGGVGVSSDDVIVGESALFDQAANRSTPTGRNFANDFYAVVSAALADEFKALGDRLDKIEATLATLTSAPTAQAIAKEVLDEEAARLEQ